MLQKSNSMGLKDTNVEKKQAGEAVLQIKLHAIKEQM